MDWIPAIVGVVIGLVLGAAGYWMTMRGRESELRGLIEEGKVAAQSATEELSTVRAEFKGVESERNLLAGRVEELKTEVDQAETELGQVQEAYNQLREDHRGLVNQSEEREASFAKREEELKMAEERLKESFENLSNKALTEQMDAFLKRSQDQLEKYKEGTREISGEQKSELEKLLKPMRERLEELDEQNQNMEQKRAGAYQGLMEQIKALGEEQTGLRKETGRLIRALQDPGSAGQWGEMVLERVVEMAGLEERVNFETQTTIESEEGRQRPDMMISLPGGRVLVVDSKAPMRQYLEGLEAGEEGQRQILFSDHAKKVAEHARALGSKKYSDLAEAPDFTIMFIPSESAFRVALEQRPALLEDAMSNNVVIATPSTMLALLRAVAYGWRQEKLAEEAREVQKMGQELYDRICTMVEHYNKAARALNSASSAFNQMGRSLETRVLPSARRFKEAGVETSKELDDRAVVEQSVQELASPDSSTLPGV